MEYNEFFTKAEECGFSNIQITENTIDCNNININNGNLDNARCGKLIKYYVKAEYRKKTINIISDYLDENIIELMLFKIKNTDSKYKDIYLKNKNNTKNYKFIDYNLDISKNKLQKLDLYRNNYKNISNLEIEYSKKYKRVKIINNKGVNLIKDNFFTSFNVQAIAKNIDKTVSYDNFILNNDDNIDMDSITIDVLEKAILSLNEIKLENGNYPILFSPKVLSEICLAFVNMISATNIRNKTTCMLDKQNEKIFSSKLNIIEDPVNKKLPGYSLFDDEGSFTRKKSIVEKGKLQTYLYDIKEAELANVKTTGNSYGSIGVRNLYIKEGTKKFDDLLNKIDLGIYVTSFIGTNVINELTGSISLQIFGFIVKNGKVENGLKTCILTTDIFELFNNIVDIGNDMTFVSEAFASPTLLVKNLSIVSE